MKLLKWIASNRVSVAVLTLFIVSHVDAQTTVATDIPHLELEMTSSEYRALNKRRVVPFSDSVSPLEAILAVGQRNLQWVDFVNLERSGSNRLEISSEATQPATPIEKFRSTNESIVLTDYNARVANLPAVFLPVLFQNAPFTRELGMTDEEFLTHVRLLDKSYQMASRWLLQKDSLSGYGARMVDDIRGYYFLKKELDLEARLLAFESLDQETKTKFQGWLLGQCVNVIRNPVNCATKFTESLATNHSALPFYQLYFAGAEEHFNSYFIIPRFRPDVTWQAQDAAVMSVPFTDPHNDTVKSWLQTNIEDEWRTAQWQLKLNFVEGGGLATTHVVFEPGATAHVNAIAGSEITMDANENLAEFSSRWTIRHEYGHVVGFPDCYLEFYDAANGIMISYQLDITNLMCSRRGKFQPKHFDELKRVYSH